MAEAEEASWWFRARRKILHRVLSDLALPSATRLADIGCGMGGNLGMLRAFGYVTGVEMNPEAAAAARKRTGLAVLTAPAEKTPLDTGSIDVVTMFDVLEHLEDEAEALREVRRILKPGGRFIFTVPAFQMLWSGHDEALHHKRRYTKPELVRKLSSSGLTVDWCSYYNASLFPPVAAVRLSRRLLGLGETKADVGQATGWQGRLLERIFAAERHVVGRLTLPVGVSLIGVATNP